MFKKILKIFKRKNRWEQDKTPLSYRLRPMMCCAYNQKGIESELIEVIGKFMYDDFLAWGYIRRPIKISSTDNIPYDIRTEWVATELLYERCDQLNLNPRKFVKYNQKYILPQTKKKKKLCEILKLRN